MAIYTPNNLPKQKQTVGDDEDKSGNPTTTPDFVPYTEFRVLSRVVIAVLVVTGLGFITLLWTTSQIVLDSLNNKTDTYRTLVEGNKAQNDKINALNTTIEVMKTQQASEKP